MLTESDKQAIRQELELLREQGSKRQVLSLHACSRLFFDFGVKPSVTTVRELTGVGSAGDIPRDIEAFWARLRDTSRTRIGQGAIPESLEGAAGELLGALYQSALENAAKQYDAQRDELLRRLEAAEHGARELELRLALSQEAAQAAQAALEREVLRREQAEQALAAVRGEAAAQVQNAYADRGHWQAELAALKQQIVERDRAYETLRRESDALRAQAQENAEHYAGQLKDAMEEAQRRVRPMLVELDNLRTLASTYQAGIKESSRREFDFMQQLSIVKGRADTLEKLTNRQADELAALHRELAKTGEHAAGDPVLVQLVADLAARGALRSADLRSLGRLIDASVAMPRRCPGCEEGEPELADLHGQIEIACPECGRSSGWCISRLEAAQRFNDVSA